MRSWRRLRLRSRMKRDRGATLRRLAAALGLRSAPSRLAAKVRGFPVGSDGTFELATVRAWFRVHARASRTRGGPSLLGWFDARTQLAGLTRSSI